MLETIARGLGTLDLHPHPQAANQLAQYGQWLLEKNRVMNLTAIREPEEVAKLHMLDSAALLKWLNLKGKTLIDVGTGAGFPGMVLKILEPSLQLTLLDGLNKRLDWLLEVANRLNLTGITALHARAEETALCPPYREGFDIATARAVAPLNLLTELCLPFVKPGGYFLAMKSTQSDEELSQAQTCIQRLGGQLHGVHDYTVPDTDVRHRVILIQKTASTPDGYPRRWAKMQKKPL